MRNCLLCDNFGSHCACEHCESYDNFRPSKEGKSLISQVRKDMAKELLQEEQDFIKQHKDDVIVNKDTGDYRTLFYSELVSRMFKYIKERYIVEVNDDR